MTQQQMLNNVKLLQDQLALVEIKLMDITDNINEDVRLNWISLKGYILEDTEVSSETMIDSLKDDIESQTIIAHEIAAVLSSLEDIGLILGAMKKKDINLVIKDALSVDETELLEERRKYENELDLEMELE
jgi:hypothetical protein